MEPSVSVYGLGALGVSKINDTLVLREASIC